MNIQIIDKMREAGFALITTPKWFEVMRFKTDRDCTGYLCADGRIHSPAKGVAQKFDTAKSAVLAWQRFMGVEQ